MCAYQPNAVLATQHYKSVGTRPIRHDGADKVTGKAQYGADMHLPGQLYGKVLRSPHAHADILSIDTTQAEALPGVRAVVTAADFAPVAPGDWNFLFNCRNVMAADKVLYRGHAVAAVAAINAHVAADALELIKVEYQILPAVFEAKKAMAPGAPILHGKLPEPSLVAGEAPKKSPNVANRFEVASGDVDEAFAASEVIVEKETSTVAVHQGYIEPHCGTAQWHGDGRLTVYSSSQGHFNVRDFTARIVGVPVSKVKAVQLEIGGGFGAKLRVYSEPVAALLARQAGAPVKLAMTRAEVFEATGPASGTRIKVKLGATKEGRLLAVKARLIFEAGAFPGSSVMGGGRNMLGPYDIANAHIEGYDVVVNRPKTAAYRAPGTPMAAFAVETALDELAEKLGLDPVALRLKNSAKQGTRRVTGTTMPRVGFVETLQAARDHDHYRSKLKGLYRGRGVASGFWGNGSGPSCAVATVNPDGSVNLAQGSPDVGGTRTSVAQQLAETLQIPVERVRPQIADTDSIGFTSNTGGSGVTFKTGIAAHEAALGLKQQMTQRAALLWETAADQVDYADGVFWLKAEPQQKMSFAEVAARQNETGGAVIASIGVNPGGAGPALAVHIVDVEVDPETGKVKILRYTALQDVGKAIHPSYVEGQMQGGAAQGIGWALNEEYFIDESGHMLNSSFLDYRMPTSLDLPMIDTVIVEVANPNHPYGVRGVGEAPIVPPLAAVANAVYHAVGVRVNDLPMKPQRVLAALAAKNEKI
jgi:xanthine dehydrogenase molybdenum-binding subunit